MITLALTFGKKWPIDMLRVLLTLAFLFPVFVGYFDEHIFNVYKT